MASVDVVKPAPTAGDPRTTALRPRQLIGRERESTEVKESVLSTPVTTLTGPGGVGKTALAVNVAAACPAEFPGGVVVVWLGSLRSAELVVSEVAAQAGLPKSGGDPLDASHDLGRTVGSTRRWTRRIRARDPCDPSS
jgi:non-specific serine/threonine protein kinase